MNKGSLHILIIEDSSDDRDLYKRLLSKVFSNPIIDEYDSSDKGRSAICENNYNIILLDYNLPGINGIDFVKSLNEMKLELIPPIIALTGQGSEKIAVEFMRLGVCDYILKSEISKETLSYAINKALETSYKDKIELEKRQEQARFAHTIAHDLRAPLGRIEAYSRMLNASQDTEKIIKYIGNIKEDSRYMIDFLDNLLMLAEIGRSNASKSTVDLNEIVTQSMHNLEIDIKKKHANVQTSKLPKIYGDAISLVQLFQNLISNSLKYSTSKPLIDVTSEVDDHYAIVKITDNGIGIAESESKKIFEPFTRLQNGLDQSGIGLGLSLCKTIAKQHKADIKISPASKGGTEVSLIFNSIPA